MPTAWRTSGRRPAGSSNGSNPPFTCPIACWRCAERRRPRSPQYLERGTRGGVLASRWNLILPEVLVSAGEPNER